MKKKKSLVVYGMKSWRSGIKLIGDEPNRYYDFPELGEQPMEGSKTKLKITIKEL